MLLDIKLLIFIYNLATFQINSANHFIVKAPDGILIVSLNIRKAIAQQLARMQT